MHGDTLDRLVTPRGVEDAEQRSSLAAATLELQLLPGCCKVAGRQAAVPLDLGEARETKRSTVRSGPGNWT